MFKILQRKKPKKRVIKGYVLIDLVGDGITLPNGVFIPKQNILFINPEKRTILYIDHEGKLTETTY